MLRRARHDVPGAHNDKHDSALNSVCCLAHGVQPVEQAVARAALQALDLAPGRTAIDFSAAGKVGQAEVSVLRSVKIKHQMIAPRAVLPAMMHHRRFVHGTPTFANCATNKSDRKPHCEICSRNSIFHPFEASISAMGSGRQPPTKTGEQR